MSIAHVLTITCDDDEDWDWSIECPYDSQYNVPGRPCTTWWECNCKPNSAAVGECPESPTKRHYLHGSPALSSPQYPIQVCWVNQCDFSHEVINNIRQQYGAGVYLAEVICDGESFQLDCTRWETE